MEVVDVFGRDHLVIHEDGGGHDLPLKFHGEFDQPVAVFFREITQPTLPSASAPHFRASFGLGVLSGNGAFAGAARLLKRA